MKIAQTLLIIAMTLLLPMHVNAIQRNITAQWEYIAIDNLAGFRLYQNDTLICSTDNPQATTMNCSIDVPDGEFLFTMTSYFSDGTESEHSEPLPFIFSSGLMAQMTADISEGEKPLPVTFDATQSTGTIISYDWMFGDGQTATGNYVSHTFTDAGSYSVTLKVTDNTGAFDQESMTILVTEPTVINFPPTAVLSSSTSVGTAPLPVQFDGSGSSDSDGYILSYAWDLGDGGTASAPQVNYTYASSGTFYSSLTVTDNGGLNSSTSTPILVQPSADSNIVPTAEISASLKKSKFPLSVQFSGRLSNDPDGKIIAYSWNFGDGSVGSGQTVRHDYLQTANYNVTLKVTDDQGAVSDPATFRISSTEPFLRGQESSNNIRTIINFLLLRSAPQEQPDIQQQKTKE